MSDVITIEAAALAYDAHEHESTQAHLAGRRKFACCRQCGSVDGMQAVHRETLEEMPRTDQGGEILATWYKEYTNSEYLFHPCLSCNRDKIIPAGFVSMTPDEVLEWIDRDPMAPDYAAPAAKLRDWADELEAVSWYDATLARKVAAHWYGPDSHPATLNALRQLREKYPDNKLLAALAAEPEQVLASIDSRQSAGLEE